MPTGSKRQTHNFILQRLKKRQVNFCICRTSGIWLNIYIRHAKKSFCPILCKRFYTVNNMISLIISFSGIPLRIFVGQNASKCLHYCGRGVVFRGNHFQDFSLSYLFLFDKFVDLWVCIFKLTHFKFSITP